MPRHLIIALITTSLFWGAGCGLRTESHGDGTVQATYEASGDVVAQVPATPATTAAAFVDALRSLGYAIMSHRVDANEATIVGRSAARSVRVTIVRHRSASQVRVHAGTFGEEDVSRAVLDAALQRIDSL
jgi:hypothetical protein